MFFKYLAGEPSEAPPPRPVYARVDQTEPVDDADDDAPSLVLLDCIDAEWLDDNADRADHLSDPGFEEADRWISVIAISSDNLDGADKNTDELPEWYRLKLGDPDHGPLAEQFHNLFQDPTECSVIDVRPAVSSEIAMLKKLAGWQNVEGAAPAAIEEVLTRTEPVDAVAVYDVGQGAATALLSHGVPTLYFDFGGSALGNWRSFPEPLNQFCMTASPPVVLSYWDWDHWSSALRDHRALQRRWILPIQNLAGDLGAVHARFLGMLIASKTDIYWWDYATPARDRLWISSIRTTIEVLRSLAASPTAKKTSARSRLSVPLSATPGSPSMSTANSMPSTLTVTAPTKL